jgi:adenosylmethionine-8-amino-7-oxononanoate aminotransferase
MLAPATRVMHTPPQQALPTAVRGEGVYLVDAHGKRYLDASGGTAVSCLGHAHPDVLAAMHGQIDQLAYAPADIFTTDIAAQLADQLVRTAPQGMSQACFALSGSEAVEAAIQIAREYVVAIGQPQRQHVIARRHSDHGHTLGTLAIGGNPWRREPFAPLLMPATHLSPCYPYRDLADGETPELYGLRLARELEETILRLGTDRVMAFVAETVGGTAAGVQPPVPGYFQAVHAVCQRYGVLLILDEVLCGLGRSGRLHACLQEGVVPDLLVVGHGLGGGYQPLSALLVHRRLAQAVPAESGVFQQGRTPLGHAVACAAALTVQQVIERDRLLDQVMARGEYLQRQLHQRWARHPHIGDIRGRGLFWGIELVRDRARKTPFEASRPLHTRLQRQALAQGLMVRAVSGTADGQQGHHVVLAPPFIISEREIDQLVDRLDQSIHEAIASL